MNEHLELGKINTLKVERRENQGVYLESNDGKEVLLPFKYTEGLEIGSQIKVFLYTDSEDRLVATTDVPYAYLDSFYLFDVIDSIKEGVFLDWGLDKDLFFPLNLQKETLRVGDKTLAYIAYDDRTHRLVATHKYSKYLDNQTQKLKNHQEVKCIVARETPMGFSVIVEDKYEGMIFKNEVFEELDIGDKRTAYIKNKRDDGKLDISLRKIGGDTSSDKDKILNYLKANANKMPINTKSDAELILKEFSMSKKMFKKALNALKDAGKIEIKENGTFLNQ